MQYIPILKEKNVVFEPSSICKIKSTENYNLFLKPNGSLYFVNKNTEENLHYTCHQPLHYHSTKNFIKQLLDFNEEFYIVSIKDKISLLRIATNEIIGQIDCASPAINLKWVNCIKLMDNNNILIGSENGKVGIYNLKNQSFILLAKMKDYIEVIENNDNIIIYGAYDGMIKIIKYENFELVHQVNLTKMPIIFIKILPNEDIFLQDKQGKIFIINGKNFQYEYVTTLQRDILNVTFYKGMCFLNTKNEDTSSVYYINLSVLPFKTTLYKNDITILINEQEEQICHLYNKKITTFENPKNKVLEILKGKSIFVEGNLYKAYMIITHNIFLENKEDYIKLMDSIFENMMLKSVFLLQKNETKLIQTLMQIFEKIPKYNMNLIELKQASNAYTNFQNMYQLKNFHMCYEVACKYKFIQKTEEYLLMEKNFKTLFQKIYKNPTMEKQKIQELLRPFLSVRKKKIYIQFLTQKTEVFSQFFQSIDDKNYRKFFQITEENPELIMLEEYNLMAKNINELYKKTTSVINVEETSKAINILRLSCDFKEEMIEKHKFINEYIEFLNYLKNGKFYFNNLNNFYILNSNEYKQIIEKYEIMYDAFKNSNKMYSKELILTKLKIFKKFKILDIFDIIKLQYIKQIYSYQRNNKPITLIENLIKKYIEFCGVDYHIQNFIEEYNLIMPSIHTKMKEIDIKKLEEYINTLPNYLLRRRSNCVIKI